MAEDSNENLKECPYCSEMVKTSAKKCKHCGATIDVVLKALEDSKSAQSSAPNVFMNSGAASSSSASSSNNNGGNPYYKASFSHGWHIVASIFTAGLWVPIWIFMYLFRDKNTYW